MIQLIIKMIGVVTFLLLSASSSDVRGFLFRVAAMSGREAVGSRCSLRRTLSPTSLSDDNFSCSVRKVIVRTMLCNTCITVQIAPFTVAVI